MYENHVSVVSMQEHISIDSRFNLQMSVFGELKTSLQDIDSSKAMGWGTIPPKSVKYVTKELA